MRRPLVPTSAAANGSHDLVVPRDHPTIQAAVDAAHPGDRISVRLGVYREQVVIGKDVSITGAGDRKTTIRAPRALIPGDGGGTSIVEIHQGASVSLSRLAVSGPGSGRCDNGVLGSGIRVLGVHGSTSATPRSPTSPTPPRRPAPVANPVPIGMALQDGSFTVRNDRIKGGVHGVAVIAASVDTSAVPDGVLITRRSGAPVQTFECCGFTAMATVKP
ncbi:hypothetical protein [Streptomyces sp. NBC_00996]|uniref:hypothetical protein n=1 Tax=Streptomyces sp. NBC_00996 TaxID=2903710 RepID=UPI0038644237|nr:hypothetical protein OG390_04410 [Streptomyces sp. NBC_00996]